MTKIRKGKDAFSFLSYFDAYPFPYSLHVNKETSLKTSFGGCATILQLLAVLAYGIYLLSTQAYAYNQESIKITEGIENIPNSNKSLNIRPFNTSTFWIEFRVSLQINQQDNPANYGNVFLSNTINGTYNNLQLTDCRDPKIKVSLKYKPNLKQSTRQKFTNVTFAPQYIKKAGLFITQTYCVNINDPVTKQLFRFDEWIDQQTDNRLEFNYMPCDANYNKYCKTKSEIRQAFIKLEFLIFEGDASSLPLVGITSRYLFFNVDVNFNTVTMLSYQQKFLKLAVINHGQEEENKLIEYQKLSQDSLIPSLITRSWFNEAEDRLMQMYPLVSVKLALKETKLFTNYTKIKENEMQYIAIIEKLGGLNSAIQTVLTFILGLAGSEKMSRFIAKKLFYKKKSNSDNCQCESSSRNKTESETDLNQYNPENSQRDQYKSLCSKIENNQMIAPTDIKQLVDYVEGQREVIKTHFRTALYYFVRLYFCCCCFGKKQSNHELRIAKQMKRKFFKATDLVRILLQFQKSKQLQTMLLNSKQNLLLKLQRQYLVESSDRTDTSDDLDDFIQETQTKEGNEKQKNQIINQLNEYCDQKTLEPLDFKLLKGIYTTNREELGQRHLSFEKNSKQDAYKSNQAQSFVKDKGKEENGPKQSANRVHDVSMKIK